MIFLSRSMELLVLSTTLVFSTLEALTPIILSSEFRTKAKNCIKLVILLTVLIFPTLKVSTLIFPPFEVKTKVGNSGVKVEIENSAKSGIDNIGSNIVRTDVTMGFRGKFSAKADNLGYREKSSTGVGDVDFKRKSSAGANDVSFRILRVEVTAGPWAEDDVGMRDRGGGYIARRFL